MPIYEYQCQACKYELEKLQKLSDDPLIDCPGCGSPALKKKVSAAGFRLKGGGWYETDFKTGSKKNLAGGSDGKSGDGAGKSDTGNGNNSGATGASGSSSGSTAKSAGGANSAG